MIGAGCKCTLAHLQTAAGSETALLRINGTNYGNSLSQPAADDPPCITGALAVHRGKGYTLVHHLDPQHLTQLQWLVVYPPTDER